MLATTTVCWMSLWRSASNNGSISLVEPCLDSIPTFLNFVFSSLQFCINFLRYHSECFLYIYTKLGRGLQELYIVIVRHILSLFLRNFPVVPHRQVRLATYEDEGCLVRFNALLGLVEPGGDVLEAVHVADVVGEDGPDTVPIIRLGDGTEPLLARGVPQLYRDVAIVHADGLHLEVDAEGGAQVGHEHSLRDPVDEGGLANRCIACEHNFVCSVWGSSGLQVAQFAQTFLSFSGNVWNIRKEGL